MKVNFLSLERRRPTSDCASKVSTDLGVRNRHPFPLIKVATAIILTVILKIKYLQHHSRATQIYRSVAEIHALLNPPNATVTELLRSRAIPNGRLIRAFGIRNTFVSDDPGVRIAFRNTASRLLKASADRGWPYFQRVAVQAVHHNLPDNVAGFDTFMQAVTLVVVVVGLLGVDVDVTRIDHHDITFVTQGITELWRRSKSCDPIPPDKLPRLNYHLRRLIPDEETFPNPLDIVIPAWETLWRVVALAFAHVHNDELVRLTCEELHENPTVDQFRAYTTAGPSVEAVIVETLRLYPPTKHISRAILDESRPSAPLLSSTITHLFHHPIEHAVADIEAVQRSSAWGPSPDIFDPLRHHPSRRKESEQTETLAFGYGRLACVASTWAPMAAGVILAAVFNSTSNASYEVVVGERIGGREGWDGWVIRKTE